MLLGLNIIALPKGDIVISIKIHDILINFMEPCDNLVDKEN